MSESEQNQIQTGTLSPQVKSFLYRAVIIVGSGGLIFGYDIGVISGTLPSISDAFDLDSYEEGLVVSILYAGSILGSLFGGPLCDFIGRWKTIQFQNLIFIIGALLTGLAPNLAVLCTGRFFVGIASAISGLADVPYLTEIAPAEYRGILSGQYEILVGAGILLSFILDLFFSSFHNGWRWAFVLPGVFAFVQSLGLFLLPESPKWLIAKGQFEKAKDVFRIIYGEQVTNAQLEELIHSSGDQSTNADENSKGFDLTNVAVTSALHNSQYPSYDVNKTSSSILAHAPSSTENINGPNPGLSSPPQQISTNAKHDTTQQENEQIKQFKYPIIVIIIIQILSQITGANVIRNYAPTIFEDGGVSTALALFYNVLLGIVKLVFTIISVYYIESTGRKKFFLFGIAWVIVGMSFLMVASIFSPSGNLQNPEVFVIGCGFVYAGFGFGYGPMPWVLSSELVPTLIRGRVICISLVASNLTQLIMNFIFIPMSEYLLAVGTYTVFLFLNIVTFYYIYHFLVETKEIQPEVILKGLNEKYNSLRNMSWKEFIGLCFTSQDRSYTELCLE